MDRELDFEKGDKRPFMSSFLIWLPAVHIGLALDTHSDGAIHFEVELQAAVQGPTDNRRN